MKKLKFIIHLTITIVITGLIAILILSAIGAWNDLPYKKTFHEYLKYSYHEVLFMKRQADKTGKITGSKKAIKHYQDSLMFKEDSLYKAISSFPEKYKDLKNGADEIHLETLNLRALRIKNFKSDREDIFSTYDQIIDSLSDTHFDSSIIPKLEKKRSRFF